MITLFYLISLLFASCNGTSCGSQNDSVPQLRVTVADVKNAGTDKASKVYVRVLFATGQFEAQWSEWQDLDTSGCDDLDRGQTDYFDLDLDGSTEIWMAIAFYSSTTDGLLIDSFTYWDGTAPVEVDTFCGLIAGPSRGDECFEDEDDDNTLCYNEYTSDPSYGSFWVDSPDCPAVAITLGEENQFNPGIGTGWAISDPGTPDNPTSAAVSFKSAQLNEGGMHPVLSSHRETISANVIQILIISALSISVISFMLGYYYFKQRYSDSSHKPLLK